MKATNARRSKAHSQQLSVHLTGAEIHSAIVEAARRKLRLHDDVVDADVAIFTGFSQVAPSQTCGCVSIHGTRRAVRDLHVVNLRVVK